MHSASIGSCTSITSQTLLANRMQILSDLELAGNLQFTCNSTLPAESTAPFALPALEDAPAWAVPLVQELATLRRQMQLIGSNIVISPKFNRACETGDIQTMDDLIQLRGGDATAYCTADAMYAAMKTDRLDIIEWLDEQAHSYYEQQNTNLLRAACQHGKLTIAKWVAQTYPKKLKALEAFVSSIETGQLLTSQWLLDKFRSKLMISTEKILLCACKHYPRHRPLGLVMVGPGFIPLQKQKTCPEIVWWAISLLSHEQFWKYQEHVSHVIEEHAEWVRPFRSKFMMEIAPELTARA